jgi:hypothetical protein
MAPSCNRIDFVSRALGTRGAVSDGLARGRRVAGSCRPLNFQIHKLTMDMH